MASNGIQETRQGGMSRSSTGLSNGAMSDFEIVSHTTSSPGSQTPVSLSHINPLAMSQTPGSMTDITLEQALARVHELSRENTELRDYLKDNNDMLKKQFETLAAWKEKVHEANVANKDKFEQTKALIVGLRKDNEELLEKNRHVETSKQEKENELLMKIHELESARLHSEQMVSHVKKQAEDQGISIISLDPSLQETVVVNVSAEAEKRINELEREIEENNKALQKYREDLTQTAEQVQQFRGSTDQLLKDLEGQQKLKDDLQKENQELNEKNLDLNLQLQALLSDTRHSLQFSERQHSGYRSDSSGSHKRGSDYPDQSHSVEQLQKNEEKLRGEVEMLRASLEGEKKKNEVFHARLQETSEKLLRCRQSRDEDVATLRKEHEQKLMELAQQQSTDREQLQSSSYNDADVQSLRSQVLTLISEVHETQTKLAAATDAIGKKDRRLHDLEEQSSSIQQMRYESQAMIQQLQQRCALYEQYHNDEKQSHVNTKRNMGDLQRSFEQLVSDYKELLDTFDQYKLQQERQSMYQQEQPAVSEQINHLTAQVMAAEEALNLRDSQIKALRDELHNKKLEYDDMAAVFKAQADVYKCDFDAERHAREKMVTEKERILSEMGDLQVQNQRLVDDLESYSRKQLSEMQRRVAPSHSYLQVGNPGGPYGPPPGPYDMYGGHSVDQSHGSPGASNVSQSSPRGGPDPGQHDEDDVPLVCPQCNLVCPDMDTLQIHVIECLDQHEQQSRST